MGGLVSSSADSDVVVTNADTSAAPTGAASSSSSSSSGKEHHRNHTSSVSERYVENFTSADAAAAQRCTKACTKLFSPGFDEGEEAVAARIRRDLDIGTALLLELHGHILKYARYRCTQGLSVTIITDDGESVDLNELADDLLSLSGDAVKFCGPIATNLNSRVPSFEDHERMPSEAFKAKTSYAFAEDKWAVQHEGSNKRSWKNALCCDGSGRKSAKPTKTLGSGVPTVTAVPSAGHVTNILTVTPADVLDNEDYGPVITVM